MVHIVRTNWSGTSGGPGLTQTMIDTTTSSFGPLTTTQAQTAVNAVRAFWNSVAPYLPNEVVLNTSAVVDYYLAHNGELAGSVSAPTAPASVTGTEAGSFAMASGLKVNLNTGVIQHGRRVRGSIFIVPAAGAFSVTGLASSTARTAIGTAGATLMSTLGAGGLKLQVWSRPIPEGKPKGPREGTTSDVNGMEVSEKTAILRGRRD